MRLLIEEPDFDGQKIIVEEEEGKKNLYIHGPFSFSDMRNNNGRIYPDTILAGEIERYQSLIKSKQAVGELDHPDSPKINLKNISHMITSLNKEGKNAWIGKAHILRSQPSGQIAAGLVEDGVQLGISSRALGSLKQEDKGKIVQDDLNMIAWDIVARPSFSKALINAIYESSEYERIGDAIVEKALDPLLRKSEIQELLDEVKKWRDLYVGKVLLEGLERRLG